MTSHHSCPLPSGMHPSPVQCGRSLRRIQDTAGSHATAFPTPPLSGSAAGTGTTAFPGTALAKPLSFRTCCSLCLEIFSFTSQPSQGPLVFQDSDKDFLSRKCLLILSEDSSERICLQCGRPRFNSWIRKIPGEGNGYPLQYSCLENSRDRGAWWATSMGSQRVRYD